MGLQTRQQGGKVVRRAQSAVQKNEDGRVCHAAGLIMQRCAAVGESVILHGLLHVVGECHDSARLCQFLSGV